MKFLLTAILLVQAAPAQSPADKLEAALKKFGDRNYRILLDGKDAGICSLKTRIEKEGGKSVAVFEDQFAMALEEQKLVMTWTQKASTDRLQLISAKHTTDLSGRKSEWILQVEGKKALIESDGKKETVEIGVGAIGEAGMVRLVCAAEQKEGASFTADVMSGVANQFQPGHSFKCVGKESLDIGGKKLDTFKWENKGEWKSTVTVDGQEVPNSTSVQNTFWVSPDGYLVRSLGNGRSELILDAK